MISILRHAEEQASKIADYWPVLTDAIEKGTLTSDLALAVFNAKLMANAHAVYQPRSLLKKLSSWIDEYLERVLHDRSYSVPLRGAAERANYMDYKPKALLQALRAENGDIYGGPGNIDGWIRYVTTGES